jgi:hypothetical protein
MLRIIVGSTMHPAEQVGTACFSNRLRFSIRSGTPKVGERVSICHEATAEAVDGRAMGVA